MLLVVFVSQPSSNMVLQSARPGLQLVTLQVAELQSTPVTLLVPMESVQSRPPLGVPLAVLQAPQLESLLFVFVSQPSPKAPRLASPLQSPRPPVHAAKVQALSTQEPVPFVN
jgi:hypothetical protein